MSRKMQSEKENMTLMQKRAVLVCILCVLAVLLTFGITTALLKKGGDAPAPSVSESAADPAPGEDLSSHYQIDNASAALLTETADAGADYLNDTLFLGDSNTVRLYNNGLISLQQFCAKEGIGTQAALNEGIVTFKKDSNHYTIPQAVAMMKPRRVVMTFGTNDTGMEVSDFIAHYTALVQAVQQSYPYTDIIVNTVPPVPVDHSNYPHMDQSKIDDFNMALLNMCEQLGVRFLNSAEALKGSDGYGIADYYTSGDIHLKSVGLKAVLNYIRTHACQTDDRRPDTNNIPTRTMEYVSNPSSAVAAPSSEAASSSGSLSESASSSESSSSSESTSSSEGKKFEAHYHVDKNGDGCPGGRLCLCQVERRSHQQDPHRYRFQAESGCHGGVWRCVRPHHQRGQGGCGQLLYLQGQPQRQVCQGRTSALVRQWAGGHAGGGQIHHHRCGGQLDGQRLLQDPRSRHL